MGMEVELEQKRLWASAACQHGAIVNFVAKRREHTETTVAHLVLSTYNVHEVHQMLPQHSGFVGVATFEA